MTNSFDYKNFYDLLNLPHSKDKEEQLKMLIDSHLSIYFQQGDRQWFNRLCNHGLIDLVYYCERTIPYFTLYNDKESVDHISNVGFLWAIESGHIELVQYFMNHEDFPKFCKRKKLEEDIAQFINLYKERSKSFTCKNLDNLIDILVEKFPWSIPKILEKLILNQKNDEITPALKSFVNKYQPYLRDYLDSDPIESNFTRLCMVSLKYDCFEFGGFLRKKYPELQMNREFVSFYLHAYGNNINALYWMIDNPEFHTLTEENFIKLFSNTFENPLGKVTKEDYQFFFAVTKSKLHVVTYEEYKKAIYKNLTPFVKKYYRQFRENFINFDFPLENTSTRYIDKQKKEQHYKDLLKKFPEKNIQSKKFKI